MIDNVVGNQHDFISRITLDINPICNHYSTVWILQRGERLL